MLNSEDIGQKPHLTSDYPRAQSAPPALVATFLVPRPRNRFAMRQLAGVVDETSRNLP